MEWSEFNDRADRHVSERLVELEGVRPGSRALDVAAGGFSNVAVERDEVSFEFDSPAHFTACVRATSAPIRAMIEQHAGDAWEVAWDAITRAAAGAGGGSGPLRLSKAVLLAHATVEPRPELVGQNIQTILIAVESPLTV